MRAKQWWCCCLLLLALVSQSHATRNEFNKRMPRDSPAADEAEASAAELVMHPRPLPVLGNKPLPAAALASQQQKSGAVKAGASDTTTATDQGQVTYTGAGELVSYSAGQEQPKADVELAPTSVNADSAVSQDTTSRSAAYAAGSVARSAPVIHEKPGRARRPSLPAPKSRKAAAAADATAAAIRKAVRKAAKGKGPPLSTYGLHEIKDDPADDYPTSAAATLASFVDSAQATPDLYQYNEHTASTSSASSSSSSASGASSSASSDNAYVTKPVRDNSGKETPATRAARLLGSAVGRLVGSVSPLRQTGSSDTSSSSSSETRSSDAEQPMTIVGAPGRSHWSHNSSLGDVVATQSVSDLVLSSDGDDSRSSSGSGSSVTSDDNDVMITLSEEEEEEAEEDDDETNGMPTGTSSRVRYISEDSLAPPARSTAVPKADASQTSPAAAHSKPKAPGPDAQGSSPPAPSPAAAEFEDADGTEDEDEIEDEIVEILEEFEADKDAEDDTEGGASNSNAAAGAVASKRSSAGKEAGDDSGLGQEAASAEAGAAADDQVEMELESAADDGAEMELDTESTTSSSSSSSSSSYVPVMEAVQQQQQEMTPAQDVLELSYLPPKRPTSPKARAHAFNKVAHNQPKDVVQVVPMTSPMTMPMANPTAVMPRQDNRPSFWGNIWGSVIKPAADALASTAPNTTPTTAQDASGGGDADNASLATVLDKVIRAVPVNISKVDAPAGQRATYVLKLGGKPNATTAETAPSAPANLAAQQAAAVNATNEMLKNLLGMVTTGKPQQQQQQHRASYAAPSNAKLTQVDGSQAFDIEAGNLESGTVRGDAAADASSDGNTNRDNSSTVKKPDDDGASDGSMSFTTEEFSSADLIDDSSLQPLGDPANATSAVNISPVAKQINAVEAKQRAKVKIVMPQTSNPVVNVDQQQQQQQQQVPKQATAGTTVSTGTTAVGGHPQQQQQQQVQVQKTGNKAVGSKQAGPQAGGKTDKAKSDTPGTPPPHVCQPGSTFDKNMQQCVLCPPGTFSVHGLNCIACPPSFYSPQAGAAQCLFCPGSETTKGMKGQATCEAGSLANTQAIKVAGGSLNPYSAQSEAQEIAATATAAAAELAASMAQRAVANARQALAVAKQLQRIAAEAAGTAGLAPAPSMDWDAVERDLKQQAEELRAQKAEEMRTQKSARVNVKHQNQRNNKHQTQVQKHHAQLQKRQRQLQRLASEAQLPAADLSGLLGDVESLQQ